MLVLYPVVGVGVSLLSMPVIFVEEIEEGCPSICLHGVLLTRIVSRFGGGDEMYLFRESFEGERAEWTRGRVVLNGCV